jgi:hypothetical protein
MALESPGLRTTRVVAATHVSHVEVDRLQNHEGFQVSRSPFRLSTASSGIGIPVSTGCAVKRVLSIEAEPKVGGWTLVIGTA